jgi:hypothetical protein
MAETLISPGVLARENDQSLVTAQPLTRGAAIIGPTVKGPVEKPTLVSSYSSFQTIFGSTLESGSQDYTYLTSIAANNYFQQGGTSLLVTRVTSGSFDPALSTTIQNNVESTTAGLAGNLIGDYTSGGTGGDKGTFTTVASNTTPNNGATFSITVGELTNLIATQNVTADSAFVGGTTIGAVAGPFTVAITSVSGGTQQDGTGATLTITTDGGGAAGALVSVVVANAGSGYVTGNILTISAADLVTAGFTACDKDLQFTVEDDNLLNGVTAINVIEDGAGYAKDDVLTIAAAAIGTPTADLVITLTDSSIVNQNAFVLETLSEGLIMNNTSPVGADTGGTELPNGALASGSADNLRWEIGAVNTASGVFSLFIRRGNDNNNQKVILESFNNISLDPFSPNYISRAIGDVTSNVVVAGDGSGTYLQESGSYPNVSNYVRVKEVNAPTPYYFDNNGVAKTEFTASLPQLGSGSFDQGVGSNLNTVSYNRFYEQIDSVNTQGVIGTDYTNAINLLANQDEYQYNVISAPGLYYSNYAVQCNLIKNMCISRGDAIYVMDLVPYNTAIATVNQNAGAIDSSYAAAYWPWLQTIDPSSGLLVYVPASTMIPGVYAFTDASSDPWFAPAGITRGGLGAVVRAERKLTSANRDTLYEANVNPIATFPQQGVVVFGQKTLQKAATALDRVNVRRLLITLKDYISQIADNLVFEQNTIATRQNFLTQVNPYLESVQQRQGLYAFKVVMDETNNTPDVIDRNELIGQIFLQPTKTAEFIILDFNVLPTGATFPA